MTAADVEYITMSTNGESSRILGRFVSNVFDRSAEETSSWLPVTSETTMWFYTKPAASSDLNLPATSILRALTAPYHKALMAPAGAYGMVVFTNSRRDTQGLPLPVSNGEEARLEVFMKFARDQISEMQETSYVI